jgi:diaminohydroxyphosphoribosylaminopyrimidine deaminase/5-amino-6-(5-phosphoribosylamino)uracil reductase
MSTDDEYMQRCLELASKGRQNVKPNPMVGCVIVHNNKIIGESYHKIYGQAHAEVNAINSVDNKDLLKESTLYVNLEPCAHYGKTPPCSDLIIHHKLNRVVIGCKDSFAKVAGKGIEKMQKAGIKVDVGILEKESINLNKAFFTFHQKQRPYIILKWAQTLDGYIDVIRQAEDPIGINWITHPNLRLPVHKWRSEESGILVGAGTAKNDNPRLNTREWFGKNPVRLLFADKNAINTNWNILDDSIKTLVFTDADIENTKSTTYYKIDFKEKPIEKMLNILYNNDIQTIIVEGGQMMLQSFIDINIWDEARVLIGDKTFGDGLKAPKIPVRHSKNCRYSNDTIIHYFNKEQ